MRKLGNLLPRERNLVAAHCGFDACNDGPRNQVLALGCGWAATKDKNLVPASPATRFV
jgi:hypothetical protein